EAGQGANEPVRILSEAMVPSGEQAFVITQHEDVIPFNHSEITTENLETITEKVLEDGNKVLPYVFALGNVKDPTQANNPSSAPIIALPNESIKNAFGLNFENVADDCSDISVIVGQQLGAKTGET